MFKNNDSKIDSRIIDSSVLLLIPELANKIGFNESIILQQVHYWLLRSNHCIQDQKWIYNTIEDWQQNNFPFFSKSTIERAFKTLRNLGLIITKNYNKLKIDKTLWYSIDYTVLETMGFKLVKIEEQEETKEEVKSETKPEVKAEIKPEIDEDRIIKKIIEHIETNYINKDKSALKPREISSLQNDETEESFCNTESVNLIMPLPETNSEISTETSFLLKKELLKKGGKFSTTIESLNPNIDTNYPNNLIESNCMNGKNDVKKSQKLVEAEKNVYSDEVKATAKRIEDLLGTKINIKTIHNLINDYGLEAIENRINNWHEFKFAHKCNTAGFFISSIRNNYQVLETKAVRDTESKNNYNRFENEDGYNYGRNYIPQHHNFEQREYTDQDFEDFYKKVNRKYSL